MKDFSRKIWKAILPPPQLPKHSEDRFKALAGLFQTFALSAWGLGIVTPLITGAGSFSIVRALTCLVIGVMLESLSLTLLSYIPYSQESKETDPNG